MNVIEKVQLVREIHQILHALDTQQVSFFEIAKSRQRLKDIYQLCDDSLFHKQHASFYALTQPKALALEFAKNSPFYDNYQGFFIRETALKMQIISGWALLHNAKKQWKAWHIVSDENYVASSPWHMQLSDLLPWLMQQYEQHSQIEQTTPCITSAQFDAQAIELAPTTPEPTKPTIENISDLILPQSENIELRDPSYIQSTIEKGTALDLGQMLFPLITTANHTTATEHILLPQVPENSFGNISLSDVDVDVDVDVDDEILTLNLGQPILKPKVQPIEQTQPVEICESHTKTEASSQNESDDLGALNLGALNLGALNLGATILASARSFVRPVSPEVTHEDTAQNTLEYIAPTATPKDLQHIRLANYQGKLQRLSSAFTDEPHTYALQLENTPSTAHYLELLVYSETEKDLATLPLYIAEQVNLQQRFSQYIVLFGAVDSEQAFKIIQDYVTHTAHHLVAIREVLWQDIKKDFFNLEHFTQTYIEQEHLVWQQDAYLPYVSLEAIHAAKLVPFEESIAQVNTPILLLKDRLKLRLIHGEKRLNLSKNESAYPALIFTRQDGVSWRLVKHALNELTKPVNVYQLYKKIQLLAQSEQV